MQLSTGYALGRLDRAQTELDRVADGHQKVTALVDEGRYAEAVGRAESQLEADKERRQRIQDKLEDIEAVLEAAEIPDETAGPQADGFAWNCRDCGFIGTWLTTDGRCPECGGRDLPTEERGDS